MDFKLLPLEIPSNEPFRYDALNRKSSIEFLTSLVEELKGPFVLAIDSPCIHYQDRFCNPQFVALLFLVK